jgi:hypothetical protein
MNRIFKNIISQSIILLLVFQVINISFNSASFYYSLQAKTAVDDPDYIDSMIEFLVENVLGCSKNMFHDRSNGNDIAKIQQNILYVDLDWRHNTTAIFELNEIYKRKINIISENEKAIIQYYKEVTPKPPQLLSV